MTQQLWLPVREQMTAQQRTIAMIAATIMTLFAACLTLYLYFSRQKPLPSITTSTTNIETSERVDQVAAPVINLPVHPAVAVAPVEIPSKNLSQIEQTPTPPPVVHQKEKTPAIIEHVDEANSTQDEIEEFEVDDFEGCDFPEEDYSWMEDDIFEENSKPEKPLSSAATKKYFIDGKQVSLRTAKCLEKLKEDLKELGKEYGQAIDNGDCGWDSFKQGLARVLGREFTIKELREKVSTEVQKLDQGPEKDNWVKAMIEKEYAAAETYEDYRDRVAFDHAEIMEKGLPSPVWLQERRDGVILCRCYNVNLVVYGVGYIDEDIRKMEDTENFYSDEPLKYPASEKYPHIIEMALYPGHFVPVWNISKPNPAN